MTVRTPIPTPAVRRYAALAAVGGTFVSAVLGPCAYADDVFTETVKSCAALRRDSERLACYDTRVAPLTTAPATATPPPAPSPEEMFGMDASIAAPAPQPQEAPAQGADLTSISGRIVGLGARARGEPVIELDNGQAWQQIDGGELLLHVGDSVIISRAAMGSFRITTAAKRTARVKRIK